MKIEKLNDDQLNYWVARAQGWHPEVLPVSRAWAWFDERDKFKFAITDYSPVNEWRHAGPLIDIYGVYLSSSDQPKNGGYYAHVGGLKPQGAYGFDAMQAICRLVIRIALGDEVGEVEP